MGFWLGGSGWDVCKTFYHILVTLKAWLKLICHGFRWIGRCTVCFGLGVCERWSLSAFSGFQENTAGELQDRASKTQDSTATEMLTVMGGITCHRNLPICVPSQRASTKRKNTFEKFDCSTIAEWSIAMLHDRFDIFKSTRHINTIAWRVLLSRTP